MRYTAISWQTLAIVAFDVGVLHRLAGLVQDVAHARASAQARKARQVNCRPWSVLTAFGYPARIVVHKSFNFSHDEADGLTRAAGNPRIDAVDLVNAMDSKLRVFRGSTVRRTAGHASRLTRTCAATTCAGRFGTTSPTRGSTSRSRSNFASLAPRSRHPSSLAKSLG
jgi:hypothetical protein